MIVNHCTLILFLDLILLLNIYLVSSSIIILGAMKKVLMIV